MTPVIVPLLSQTTRSALCRPHSSCAASVSEASAWIVTSRSRATDNILATRIGFVLNGSPPSKHSTDGSNENAFRPWGPASSCFLLDEDLEAFGPQGVICGHIWQTNITAA